MGRFGSMRQAYDFVRGIPVRPNSDVWATLLRAATPHGDMDMANIASREVFELSRKGRPGAYMAFSNTLCGSREVGRRAVMEPTVGLRGL